MSFYRDTIRTARKEHKCDLCHGIIKIGDKYHDRAGNSANDESCIYWAKECEACQPVIKDFVESSSYDSSEGYCDEYIQEWWREEKCRECNYRFEDDCDGMTHYCRCEKYEKVEELEGLK